MVAPRPPATPSPSRESLTPREELEESSWDEAEQLRSSALIPLEAPPPPTRVAEVTPRVRAPVEAERYAALPAELQEQLFEILRATLDASLVPLLEKQRELEGRLVALRAVPVRSLMPSIPVLQGELTSGSLAPASIKPTSYGYVITPSVAPREGINLTHVGPIDIPDFGTNRSGRVLLVLLVGGVVAAIVAMFVSRL